MQSAALLVYRLRPGGPEYLLGHPGGPFWRKRDDGVWSVPKGEVENGETRPETARREFEEETGLFVTGPLLALTPCQAYRGKTIWPFLTLAELDLGGFRSRTFTLAWPPGSGQMLTAPELDRIGYFALAPAIRKILAAQRPILKEAQRLISSASETGPAR